MTLRCRANVRNGWKTDTRSSASLQREVVVSYLSNGVIHADEQMDARVRKVAACDVRACIDHHIFHGAASKTDALWREIIPRQKSRSSEVLGGDSLDPRLFAANSNMVPS